MSMDAGGLAHMTYNGFPSNGLGAPGSGFGSRNRGSHNPKRLSVGLPQQSGHAADHFDPNPTPRTSRSHLLAGLRTAPKTPSVPASAPYHQLDYQSQAFGGGMDANSYNAYMQGVPQTATGASFGGNNNHYGGRQHQQQHQQQQQQHQQQQHQQHQQHLYSMPEQVLAPPTFYGQDAEMDPNMMEQLQLTSLFLAQRQQQLQQQLAAITAAANSTHLQGLNMNQFQQPMSPQPGAYGQQTAQAPIEVPGQPGVYLVFNPMTGQYQYAVDNNAQQSPMSPASQAQNGFFNNVDTPQKHQQPVFRAEISPPPTERPTPTTSRSITPPKKSASPLAHVEPLPPPSANAFRRGHKKASSLAINSAGGPLDGPKTSSVATFGTARSVFPPTPMTGTFGPGAARAGEHPIRQPRGPPPLEELVALPTSKHEGSKNFATRQRRRALDNLVRAGSVRRAVSGSSRGSPTSERELRFQSEEDEPCFRKQSPIGSERNAKRSSNDSLDGLGSGGAVQTPGSEQGDAFDMASFARQLPSPIQQGQGRRKMMLGVLNAAEKRKSTMF